jgi:ABC-type dipeptide/oligopeptide/nickel transport system ATPase component
MIAMALACGPALLIADEPTTALDVTIQAQILDLLRRLQAERGMAVLLITHDLGVGGELYHRVAVIYAGRAIKFLHRSYSDLATPRGRGFMAMMSAMAEDERLRIIKRTHEGRQIARAKGVRMGRKPKLTPHQMKEARQRLAEGEPTRSLAKSYGVSISTISRLAA